MNQESPKQNAASSEPIQALWIGERLRTMQRLSIASFLAQGHSVHLYAYDQLEGVPDGTTLLDAGRVLPGSEVFTYQKGFGRGSHAGFSDLFRYKMLLENDGWWVDLDTVALRPFDFDREHVFGYESPNSIVAGVIRSPVGSKLMQRCYETACSYGQDIAWGEIGPPLFHQMVHAMGLTGSAEPPVSFYPIHWKQCGRLIIPGGRLPRQSYAVHLWHQMWRWGKKNPEGVFPPDCIYERLKRRYLI